MITIDAQSNEKVDEMVKTQLILVVKFMGSLNKTSRYIFADLEGHHGKFYRDESAIPQ